ncbi:phosphonate C-P lyase system protein PhnH [Pseudochelatococcus sp. B33]
MNAITIAPHFADPVHQSQRAFRGILTALARPGRIIEVCVPTRLTPRMEGAVAAIVLTLLDHDTPLWLDRTFLTEEIRRYLRYHTGAPCVVDLAEAAFALIGEPEDMPPLDAFAPGEPAYPDRSTTLILQLPSLEGGQLVTLSGPGIEHEIEAAPTGLPEWFWPAWNHNASRYPLGIDAFLASGNRIMGLPRTAKATIR